MVAARAFGWMCMISAAGALGACGGDPASGGGDGDGDAVAGDGDGDVVAGDGDGDAPAGDGDGDGDTMAGDGDGDAMAGDGDGDGDTSGPVGPSVARVLQALDARTCEIARRCESRFLSALRDELAAACAPGIPTLGDGLAYTQALGRGCLDALAAQVVEGCHPSPPLPAECDDVIHGTLLDGEGCERDAQCELPLVCLGLGAGCGGVCGEPGALGEGCGRDAECTAATRCDAGACVDAQCRDDLDCAQGEHCNAEHLCAPRPQLDQTCVFVDGISPCADALVCGGTPGFWTCGVGAAAGGSCSERPCADGQNCARTPCADGLRCVSGSCTQVIALDAAQNCNLKQCVVGYVCNGVTGVCEPRRALGETCSYGRCFEGLCIAGVCTLGPEGEDCTGATIAPECEGHCAGGKCRAQIAQGYDCTSDAQCEAGLLCEQTCQPPICE